MIKILGIDPSTNHIGVSMMVVDSIDFSIKSIDTFAIDLTHISNINHMNTNQYYRLNKLSLTLRDIIKGFNPNIMAYESPFIDKFKMSSALPLGQSIMVIEEALYQFNPNITVAKYSPHNVKNAVGAKAGANKIDVLIAINKLDYVLEHITPSDLTDHEVDATAICLALLRDVKLNPSLLF